MLPPPLVSDSSDNGGPLPVIETQDEDSSDSSDDEGESFEKILQYVKDETRRRRRIEVQKIVEAHKSRGPGTVPNAQLHFGDFMSHPILEGTGEKSGLMPPTTGPTSFVFPVLDRKSIEAVEKDPLYELLQHRCETCGGFEMKPSSYDTELPSSCCACVHRIEPPLRKLSQGTVTQMLLQVGMKSVMIFHLSEQCGYVRRSRDS